MLRALVPEASVDEDSDALPSEGYVDGSAKVAQRLDVKTVAKAACMKRSAQQ
jgi:hypothetical protein